MRNYILRLDDACEKRDIEKWDRMERLLDKYGILPIVGIIPNCHDSEFADYPEDTEFWERVCVWADKGWHIAMHGYEHVYSTSCAGINPVNTYSEFAGVPLEKQKEMLSEGVKIFRAHGLKPRIFFAPAHTFDANTVAALLESTDIRIISDTVANDIYSTADGITYIPQQSGKVRSLPFRTVTFCYHPNTMTAVDFDELEAFFLKYLKYFGKLKISACNRKINFYDKVLRKLYFLKK